MKLRSITLADVRQFTRPVRVAGIVDGLNVLSAVNESGKSTLFDAIQAMFFIPHRSSKIAPLKPNIGGNPEITLEIDVDGIPHSLRKRWGRGALAEVTREGRLIAKGDEAEAFIAALTQPADEGGPAGLLWVRQGLTTLDGGTSKEQKSAHTARRDLMSSVTGEFEALTGGKRMDRALTRAREDLGQLVTLRGAKAGGPLDAALKHCETLEKRLSELTERAAHLRERLQQRRDQRRLLAELGDPVEEKARQERLTRAKAAFEAADRHAEALRAAAAQLHSAEMAQTAAVQQRDARARAAAASTALAQDVTRAQADADQTMHAADQADADLKAATAQAKTAQHTRRQCDARLQTALRAAARQSRRAHHADLRTARDAAQALAATLPDLQHAAATGPDATTLQAIDDALRSLQVAEGLARAAAPRMTIHYDTPQTPQARLNGSPFTGTTALTQTTTLELPGYGHLTIEPGRGADETGKLTQYHDQLAGLLGRCGLATADDARAAARDRADAQTSLRNAMADLKRLAPNGIDALHAEIARMEPDAADEVAEDPDTAQHGADSAAKAQDAADLAVEKARALRDVATEAQVRASTESNSLEQRLAEARSTRDALPAAALLDSAVETADATLQTARARHDALAADAPDITACRAALDRAQDVIRRTNDETNQLNIDLTKLDTLIEVDAGNGIDEDLADTALQLGAAQISVEALQREVAVLKALIAALETAQSSARDRYFAPVLAELRPMLRLLWPDAELHFDGDSLLPSALVRDGQPEDLGTLSGGTREQIALLVRLAFARLLAKAGHHAPVILDDALVYTDDDRIERMFDALHAQAGDLQILVLSCRNRALRALGGQKLTIERLDETA